MRHKETFDFALEILKTKPNKKLKKKKPPFTTETLQDIMENLLKIIYFPYEVPWSPWAQAL